MYKLSWVEFDNCISSISKKCKNKSFEGVYGFPRGGLCLADALIYSLELPLLSEPKENSLLIDDIYESGYTLEKIRNIKGSETHVWVSKKEPTWWNAYKYIKDSEWIIFPWENINEAEKSRDLYYKARM